MEIRSYNELENEAIQDQNWLFENNSSEVPQHW